MSAIILFVMSSCFASYGGLVPSTPSTYKEVSTYNTHVVDKVGKSLILRGSTPRDITDMASLKNHGIDEILIFKNQSKSEVDEEIIDLKLAGYTEKEIAHISMPWRNFTSFEEQCQMTLAALRLIDSAVQRQKSLYIHCTVGQDRTGILSSLWKLWNGSEQNVQQLFQTEMCAKGYEAAEKNKPPFVIEGIRKYLTPFYEQMAEIVLAGKMEGRSLWQLDCLEKELPEKPSELVCSAMIP